MVEDALALVRKREISAARFRIGEYELREPDYRQIRRWAEALGKSPEEVLATLAACRVELEVNFMEQWEEEREPVAFEIKDGYIVSLAWDFNRLPLIPENWEPGLRIRTLGYTGGWPNLSATLRPCLRQLESLVCGNIGISACDLSQVPGLTKLYCIWNNLTELDLTPVPGLTKLYCSWNNLTELDLTPVPGLTVLECYSNRLTELDLTPVPGLTILGCSNNPLTELDLTPVPGLADLGCDRHVRVLNAPTGLVIHDLRYS